MGIAVLTCASQLLHTDPLPLSSAMFDCDLIPTPARSTCAPHKALSNGLYSMSSKKQSPSSMESNSSGVTKSKRRNPTKDACNHCRASKVKVSDHDGAPLDDRQLIHELLLQCSGGRPKCARCTDRRFLCTYETREGQTRTASLKESNDHLKNQVSQLIEILEQLRQSNQNYEMPAAFEYSNMVALAEREPKQRMSQPQLKNNASRLERFGWGSNHNGFDPNDGRIHCDQQGWHNILKAKTPPVRVVPNEGTSRADYALASPMSHAMVRWIVRVGLSQES